MSADNCVEKTEEILSDDEDYFSCLSDLAPFASNECLFGGGFGLDDRSYGLEEVDARFDRSGTRSNGITIIPRNKVSDRSDDSGEDDKGLDDIRYLFGDSSDMSSSDQLPPSNEPECERNTVIDWSRFFGLQEVVPPPVISSRRTSSEAVNIWLENYLRTSDHSDSEDETTEDFDQMLPLAESNLHDEVKELENGTPGDLGNGIKEKDVQTESEEDSPNLRMDENSNLDFVSREVWLEKPLEHSGQKCAVSPPAENTAPKPRERLAKCVTLPVSGSPKLACITLQTESEMTFRNLDKSLPSDLKSALSEESGLKRKRAENAIYGYEPSVDEFRDNVEVPEPEVVEDSEKIPEVKKKSRFRRFLSSIRGIFPCLKRKSRRKKDDKEGRD